MAKPWATTGALTHSTHHREVVELGTRSTQRQVTRMDLCRSDMRHALRVYLNWANALLNTVAASHKAPIEIASDP